jgi:hypothetical protein
MDRVALNREIAGLLSTGTVLEHISYVNSDGTAQRFKVTSVKVWKRDPSRIAIGVKRGMYQFDTLYACDLPQFTVSDREYADIRMRMLGYQRWSFRSIRMDGSYTWRDGWISASGYTRLIGNARVYGLPEEQCANCGNDRGSQRDNLNPFPKLCSACGSWY